MKNAAVIGWSRFTGVVMWSVVKAPLVRGAWGLPLVVPVQVAVAVAPAVHKKRK